MARDPYQYFRVEARELLAGLSRGVLDLEKGGPAPMAETIRALLRLAHTFKGAARVVKQTRLSELAHALEETLSSYRDGKTEVPKDRITQMLRALDEMSAAVAALDPVKAHTIEPEPKAGGEQKQDVTQTFRPASDEPLETVRVSIEEMDKLLEGIAEAGAQLAAIRREVPGLQHAALNSGVLHDQLTRRTGKASGQALLTAEELRVSLSRMHESLAVSVEQLSAELLQIGDAANQLRLLPASAIFAALERTARDAGQALNKNVTFDAAGGETRLDAHVLSALRDALLHVVRNAVAHGIEMEAQRKAAGKSASGSIKLTVERRGNRAAFICRDDGRGIDVTAIRKAAVQRGLVSADKAGSLEFDDAVELILKGGVSTTGDVTEVSGRGVGLDVVRATAARLKGTVAVRTQHGRETTVEICVPISLASLTALKMEAAGVSAWIPLDGVRQTMRVSETDLARTGEGASVVFDGRSIPFVYLADLLRIHGKNADHRKARSAVVVHTAEGEAALGVERLLGTANVVVRPLPQSIQAEAFVTGASLDADGNPELVLDPPGIIAAAKAPGQPPAKVAEKALPPILVIDDSLTTRMLEQSILESAGYTVELAVCAEEGLEKARGRRFGVIIVDVEMPGMDGFQFVERVQADPSLREVPCILVTSRNAPEDILRGKKAGARAYVVKGEFNQDFLLQTIRGLLG